MPIHIHPSTRVFGTLGSPEDTPLDFSSAAFFIASATLAQQGDVTLNHVSMHPDRTGFLRYVILMGGRVHLLAQRWVGEEPVCDFHIQHAKQLKAIDVRAEHMSTLIKELPLLLILAACALGKSTFRGLDGHIDPERLGVMIDCLTALGVSTEVDNGILAVTGGPAFLTAARAMMTRIKEV